MFYVLDFSNNSPTSTIGDKISFEFLFEIFCKNLGDIYLQGKVCHLCSFPRGMSQNCIGILGVISFCFLMLQIELHGYKIKVTWHLMSGSYCIAEHRYLCPGIPSESAMDSNCLD